MKTFTQFVTESTASFPTSRSTVEQLYPRAGAVVDGRAVRQGPVPNTNSIAASVDDYVVLPGIRVVPTEGLALEPRQNFYAKNDFDHTEKLADQIRQSREISPLIVVVDHEGPYILEGIHRACALHLLGAKAFPALVVLDLEHINDDV